MEFEWSGKVREGSEEIFFGKVRVKSENEMLQLRGVFRGP